MSKKVEVKTSTHLSAPSAQDGVKVPEREVTASFTHPETLAEAVTQFGEKPVFNRFLASLNIEEQKAVRSDVLWAIDYAAETANDKAQKVADTFSLDRVATGRKLTPEQKEERKTDQAVFVFSQLVKAEEAGTLSPKGAEVLARIRDQVPGV